MRPADRVLVHQVHPAKIGADVTASIVSDVLLWQARPKAALAVRVLLPLAGSAAVLRFADLDTLARTGRGRYVLAHMPPSAQAVRLAGDAMMGLGAHRHRCALIIAGAAVVVAGWSHAVWPSGAGRRRPGAGRRQRPDPGVPHPRRVMPSLGSGGGLPVYPSEASGRARSAIAGRLREWRNTRP